MTRGRFTNDPATVPVTSVAGRTGDVTLTKTDVGLGNVDNTSDANKPVSTAQAAAIALKADSSSVTAALALKADTTALTAGLALKEPVITAGTTSQFWRGDKTWQTIPSQIAYYVNGTLQAQTRRITITGTTSGGTVTFSAASAGTPIFSSIFPTSANMWVPSIATNYIFDNPVLSGDKLTITANIRVMGLITATVALVSVVTGVQFSNPTNGTTVNLTIDGLP